MSSISANTFQATIPRFPIQVTIAEDSQGGWIRQDSNAGTTYFGFTILGADENNAVWKIRREIVTGNITSVAYADGNLNFDNIWADRAALNYS